jgi:hypothetical protein
VFTAQGGHFVARIDAAVSGDEVAGDEVAGGGKAAAVAYTLIGSAKLNGVDPQA